jgi:hypothetical protein
MKEQISPYSTVARSIVIGAVYEHYKKKRYKVLAMARHSETLEELVVYQALYGDGDVWIRPVSMFFENVVIERKSQPRFQLLIPDSGRKNQRPN